MASSIIRKKHLLTVITFVAILYAIQVLSPLRLGGDANAYLSMALSGAEGQGLYANNPNTHFPPGYPAILAGFIKLGLGSSFIIVALNLLALTIGMVCAYRLLQEVYDLSSRITLAICCFVLFSYIYFQYSTRPYSEMTFLAVSILCLWLMWQSDSNKKGIHWGFFTMACLVAAWAVVIRTIGITLFPVLCWLLIFRTKLRSMLHAVVMKYRIARVAAAFCLMGATFAMLWILSGSQYYKEMIGRYQQNGVLSTTFKTLGYRLTEWGQLITNCPFSFAPIPLKGLFPIAGAIAFGIGVYGFLQRRRYDCTDMYVAVYVAVLLLWPYWDARFWLPVMPFIVATAWRGVSPLIQRSWAHYIFGAYITCFCLVGLLGLAYNTRISISGKNFPTYYHYPGLQNTYKLAWGKKHRQQSGNVNEQVLKLLRQIEPYAEQ